MILVGSDFLAGEVIKKPAGVFVGPPLGEHDMVSAAQNPGFQNGNKKEPG